MTHRHSNTAFVFALAFFAIAASARAASPETSGAIALAKTEGAAASTPAKAASIALVEARVSEVIGNDLALESVRPHRALPAEVHEVLVSFRTAPRAGAQTIGVTAVDGRGARVETWAELRLVAMKTAIVATRALAAGDQLRAGDVETRRVKAGTRRTLDVAEAMLVGARVLTAIEPGEVLAAEAVELPPPIGRGAPVRVIVRVGSVTVSAEATLERAALPGQATSARLVHGARLVKGRLADRETLIVEGGRP